MIFEKINIAPEKKNVYLSAYISEVADIRQRKRPAVIVLPGGGYMACANTEGEPVALRFATMGYRAFVLQYSTLFKVFPAQPDMSRANPEAHFPGPMEDVGRAILTIRENAEIWGVDADKIILCGFSAGGHLAGMYSTHWNDPELAKSLGAESDLLRPSAAILSYGVLDLEKCERDDSYDVFNYAICGKDVMSEEEIIKYSPAKHVKAGVMPPAFIWATAEDDDVPVANSLSMAMAMAENKIPFDLHIFEKGQHALSLADESCAMNKDRINPDVAKWVSLADAWLKKHFSL